MQPIDPLPFSFELHQAALRDLPVPAVILDAERRIVFANSAYETLSGYSVAELLREGHPILSDVDAGTAVREALSQGAPFREEVRSERKDGTPFWSVLALAPLQDVPTTHFVGVLTEVSDSVRATDRTFRTSDATTDRCGTSECGSGADPQQLSADLHAALDRREIVAHFQPQYDARNGYLTGYEALARWHHAELGAQSPDRFIALAETDGLITELGTQILDQACRFADFAAAGRPLQMQVNVSVEQLRVRGLADRIGHLLDAYPQRTWSLNVEITESALILDRDLALAELDRLRELGVGVSIDDFGSGYSSLTQLRDLPATELKIDRSFVHREDAVGTSLLTAIVALASSLGLLVVAEGIETPSQLARVRALGCDRLQGMYLCSPLSPEEALTARPDIADLLLTTG